MSEKEPKFNNVVYSEQSLDDSNISNDVCSGGSLSQSSKDFSVETNAMKNQTGDGWISLHRKLLENPIAKKSDYMNLWIHLLLMANHKDNYRFIFNNEEMILNSGQILTGRKVLSHNTGISETTIERILSYFEKTKQIGQQKTTKNRVITILKWKTYQKLDNKRTTNGQQTDTYNNINNIIIDTSKKEFLQGAQINELIEGFKEINPMYKEFFKNKTERKAIDDLARQITYDKLKATIEQLPKIIGQPYAPRVTKPTELKRDLGKLIAFSKQKKSETIKKTTPNFII
jgi:hypothetical protein